jgi:hypothetical protein
MRLLVHEQWGHLFESRKGRVVEGLPLEALGMALCASPHAVLAPGCASFHWAIAAFAVY